MLNQQILATKDNLHVHKMEIFPLDMIEEAETKTWAIRLAKKFVRMPSQEGWRMILDCEGVSEVDVQKLGVFGATELLIEIRKYVNLVSEGKSMDHFSVVKWPTCAVFAVNQKDKSGTGTTRIVTPYKGETDTSQRLRVLDLSYPEIQRGLLYMTQELLITEVVIAESLIGLVHGHPIEDHLAMQIVEIQDVAARFVYGLQLNQTTNTLHFDEKCWLARKKTKVKVAKIGVDSVPLRLCSF
jgi:hypothetical protein